MECNLENRENLIARYNSGELSEADALKFEEHYFQCEVCFRELRAAEDAINLIGNEGKSVLNLKESADKKVHSDSLRKIFSVSSQKKVNWGIAVSFAIIIAVILIITLPGNNKYDIRKGNAVITKNDSTSKIVQEKSIQKPEQKNLTNEELAANLTGPDFTPNQYLEEMSTENVRSVNEKLDKVISPASGIKIYNKDIAFRWSMIQNEPVTIKILTNKEKEVVNKSIEKGFPNFTINVAPDIFKHSGLYYWKIEDKDEVLHIGKFYFIKQEHK
jgi:hypothetical protein